MWTPLLEVVRADEDLLGYLIARTVRRPFLPDRDEIMSMIHKSTAAARRPQEIISHITTSQNGNTKMCSPQAAFLSACRP